MARKDSLKMIKQQSKNVVKSVSKSIDKSVSVSIDEPKHLTLGAVRDNIDVACLNNQFLSYYRNILEDSLLDHLGQYMLAITNRELIEDIFTGNYNPNKKNPKIRDK